jgi:putative flippase GtrA
MQTLASSARQRVERVRVLLARPIRFGVVGAGSAAVQLGMLAALVQLGVRHELANILALATSTQVNFLLSAIVIWPDRPTSPRAMRTLLRRLASFNGMSITTILINEGVFALAIHAVPYLAAGLCGIAVAAPVNYLAGHYLIFRPRVTDDQDDHERKQADDPGHVRLRRLPGL